MPADRRFFEDSALNSYGLKPEEISVLDTIRRPGKFEGEMYYVPYFWDRVMEGGSGDTLYEPDAEDASPYEVFEIEAEDRKLFPELKDVYSLWLYERGDGFVIAMHMSAKEDRIARRKLGEE